jgi:putative membrane protein
MNMLIPRDFVTLLLANMAAGLVVLAVYFLRLPVETRHGYGIALLLSGIVAAVGGFYMSFIWPLPGAYNSLFGELSVLLGTIFAAVGWSLMTNGRLTGVAIYALIPSILAVMLGMRVLGLGMTAQPLMAAIGFWLTGVGGLLAAVAVFTALRRGPSVVAGIVLVLAAGVWLLVATASFWMHMQSFSDYKP